MRSSNALSGALLAQWPGATVATTFFQRFLGMAHPRRPRRAPLIFPGCRTVHTFHPLRPLMLTFVDDEGRPLARHRTRWGRVYRHPRAAHAVESEVELSAGSRPSGVGLTEALVALPLVLLIGLSSVELFLLTQSKLLLSRAAESAARFAAVRSGTVVSIEEGLARGLIPLLVSAPVSARDATGAAEAYLQGLQAYGTARLERRVHWSRVSPTAESFQDWADPQTGSILPTRSSAGGLPRQPNGASAGNVGSFPVGAQSGQTEVDAGMIKLWVGYAVPLRMPLAGPLLASAVAAFRGCPMGAQAYEEVGAVRLRDGLDLGSSPLGPDWGPGVSHLEGCALLLGEHPLQPSRHFYVAQAQGLAQAHTPIEPQ